MKLDFIVIGGQKCGSTYIHTVINQHPDVQMPMGESAHFESPDYENGGLKQLEQLLSKLDQTKKIGIKRPNYLCKAEVVDRIYNFDKDMKLIVILRNPIDRLKSSYFHRMNYGVSPILPLNEGIDKLLQGKLKKKYPRTEELIEFGYYAKYLKEYIKKFGDKLLILFYDDLVKDKLGTIKKCYSFLELDDKFVPDEKSLDSRPQKVNYSLLRTKLLTQKNRFRFTYNESRTRLFVKKQNSLDHFICRNIDRIDRYILSKYFVEDKKPRFNPDTLSRLAKIYKEDVKELEAMCQVDLSHWISYDA